MEGDERGDTILVVDDEEGIADVYAARLQRQYDEVGTAYGGEAALEALEARPDVDVVLLDRRMPDLSGDEVLAEIRAREYGCRVVMVTAVDADFDLLNMPFDDYLQKPIKGDALFDVVDQQLTAKTYGEQLSEFQRLTSKLTVLEAEKSAAELEDNDEYQQLRDRANRLEAELHETIDEFDEVSESFTSINRN